MNGRARAFVLDLPGGARIALGLSQVTQLVRPERIIDVPAAPAHCRWLIEWNDRLVPVLDLERLLGLPQSEQRASMFAVVTIDDPHNASNQFGALGLTRLPFVIDVDDSDACELPSDVAAWHGTALACFRYQERECPIPDLTRLFAAGHAAVARSQQPTEAHVEPHEKSATY